MNMRKKCLLFTQIKIMNFKNNIMNQTKNQKVTSKKFPNT